MKKCPDIKIINGAFEKRSPESQGLSSRDIAACLDAIKESGENVHSLWIFRNGYNIAGGDASPFNEYTSRRVYSTMKSVIALAILFCVQEGRLRFEDRISDYFQEDVPENCAPEIKELTLRQTLNMSVGQYNDALGIFHASKYGLGMVPFTMREKLKHLPFDPTGMTIEQIFFALPVDYKPGTKFYYVNTVPELLIRLVTKVTGTDFIHYLKPRLFDPMNIKEFNSQETMKDGWNPSAPPRKAYDPVETYLDGSTTVTTTSDLCKFALLLLQKGSWEGKQLIREDLVEEATALHIPTYIPGESPEEMSYGYGMQIWRNQYGGFSMVGGSGQAAIILPKENLIVVYTSMNSHMAETQTKIPGIVRDHLIKRLFGYPIAEDKEGEELLAEKYARWSLVPNGLLSHISGEEKYSCRYSLKESCDGITAVSFDFKDSSAVIEQGEKVLKIKFGLDGELVNNPGHLEFPAEAYSHVYGAPDDCIYAGGGWMSDGCFILQIQHLDDLQQLRYTCVLGTDGTMDLTRYS